ncbi:hypothetical protein T484DRAFT_1770125 [Baffinella frigidus]|nr:hypothetical protein T484DRAFT_1770125 [Cryptophyta sp. CCMP2293]
MALLRPKFAASLSPFARNVLARPVHSTRRMASTLVIADHNNAALFPATLSAVTAAMKLGGDITVLVGGAACGAVAEAAAKVAGVKVVIKADSECLGKGNAENMESLVLKLQAANKYSHILGAASAVNKAFLPRVAAMLDVEQISEVVEVVSEDTFVRPIYAGNALATVQSGDATKILTVRSTNFEKAEATGGSATVEDFKVPKP